VAPERVVQAPARQASVAAQRASSAFSNPNFVKLWAGQSVSLIGTQVTQFTMPLIAIISLNATVAEVGVLNALRFLPVLLLSLFAGVWLDRRRRRPVLIACALGNAVLIGVVPLASVTGLLSVGLAPAAISLVTILGYGAALFFIDPVLRHDRRYWLQCGAIYLFFLAIYIGYMRARTRSRSRASRRCAAAPPASIAVTRSSTTRRTCS